MDGVHERLEKIQKVRKLLENGKLKYATTITEEMGKPLKESIGEVDKCIAIIDYYNKHSIKFLEPEILSDIPDKYSHTFVMN